MSYQGIHEAARMMAALQTVQVDLIRMGTSSASSEPIDKQDILLGQMFAKAHDAIKDDFARIVAMQESARPRRAVEFENAELGDEG